MIIKTLGIALVMLSTTLTGMYFASRDKFRINDLAQMKKALLILKSEIEYNLTPLPLAMKNAGEKIGGPVNQIFLDFAEGIKASGRDGVSSLWTASIAQNKKECYFEPEDLDCFRTFGRTMGYLDKGLQKNNIDLAIGYLDDKIDQLQQGLQKNSKLYNSLGILSGLVICILLI